MKIQNTFTKGKMNKDVDERLVPKGEFIEGYNIRVLNTTGSDAGAIENEKGNTKLSNITAINNPVCIGSVADEAEEKIYWFVVNADGYSYIYEYDVQSQRTDTVLADERLSATQVLNFDSQYKITGVNILYNTVKKEKLLLFTDGLNSPKMVNIKRAKGYGLNGFSEDDIALYKKPPRFAPSVNPYNTADEVENSVKDKFFAFGYRYKYLDGGYSAISSFTYFQFTPKPFEIEWSEMTNQGMENAFNAYRIDYNTGDQRVTDVQLLFKYPSEPTIYVIETINKKESGLPDNATESYDFVNKKIYRTLPQDEVLRIFDDVPLTAKAQDVINDRIIFGNTTSQYDLLENESDENTIKIDYDVTYTSQTAADYEIVGFIVPGSEEQIKFDFTDIQLTAGTRMTFILDLYSIPLGGPPAYFGGSAVVQSSMVLSATYSTVSDMTASTEFVDLVAALSGAFEQVAETTSPPGTVTVTYGPFQLSGSPPPSNVAFWLDAPVVDHTDSVPTTISEQYLYNEGKINTNPSASNRSLKSNRTFEVGLVYLDEYGRYSSVLLPNQTKEERQSEIYVKPENSVDINRLKIQLKNPAPYWADRYKFFVKTNKSTHYTIYGTIYYADGLDRWVLLEGANAKKVEQGQTLYVKSDTDTPILEELKVNVLEVAVKSQQDEISAGDGWIAGNTDLNGNPLIEKSGLYMKIRPNNFAMEYNENLYLTYKDSDSVSGALAKADIIPMLNKSWESEYGFLQTGSGTTFVDTTLSAGSKFKLKMTYGESDGSPNFSFEQEWYVNQNYETTGTTQHALDKFLQAETNFVRTTGVGVAVSHYLVQYQFTGVEYTIPSNTDVGKIFYVTIFNETNGPVLASPAIDRWNVQVRTNEQAATFETGTLRARFDFTLSPGTIIFETEALDIDDEIYYETEECFAINNSGYHQGNIQNQDASNDAIVSLGFGNCFSFGNGAESVRIYDDRFKPEYDIKSRPNISLIEGYGSLNEKNKLIYSGSFSEQTGYNTLNEFNTGRGISKYLDVKYGSIQKLFARERDLIVFQEDRVSKVLYEKNILTSPDGSGSLTQIEQVLGQDVPYSGEYGISLNPESFAEYEGRMYFTDANKGVVLRLSNDGIQPISYAGMKAFYKEFLQANKKKYNLGGFDVRNHQYVLCMTNSSIPSVVDNVLCGTTFSKTVSSAYSYTFELSNYPGTININYSTSEEISIDVVYNSVLYPNPGLTGTGTVSFAVTQVDLDATRLASVTVTPASAESLVTLTHDCPTPEIMDVVLVVVNDAEEAGKTIINRHKVGADGEFKSVLDVFAGEGASAFAKTTTARFETISGYMGTGYIPNNGDVVVVQSYKNPDYHTGTFIIGTNRIGYYVSNTPGLTATQIRSNAIYPGETLTTAPNGAQLHTMNFTFNRTLADEKLYIIWDYID
jgi:hypothetical protein